MLCHEEWPAMERRYVHYYGKSPSARHKALPMAIMLIDTLIECRYMPITEVEDEDVFRDQPMWEMMRREMFA